MAAYLPPIVDPHLYGRGVMKYYQVIDGEWYEPTKSRHLQGCCDCGLVHVVDFRIAKRVKGGFQILSSKKLGLTILKRAVRNDKLTANRRRQIKRRRK